VNTENLTMRDDSAKFRQLAAGGPRRIFNSIRVASRDSRVN